jgi:catalase
MPLPNDEKLIALSEDVLRQFETIFGAHPGFRPAHAKGILLSGTFTPAPEATSLTRAPHITRPSTPVTVRFSNATGIPMLPDNDPNANPRGMAIRFQLAEHVHTDIVAQSTDAFPTRTGAEFLEFLRALSASSGARNRQLPLRRSLAVIRRRWYLFSFQSQAHRVLRERLTLELPLCGSRTRMAPAHTGATA